MMVFPLSLTLVRRPALLFARLLLKKFSSRSLDGYREYGQQLLSTSVNILALQLRNEWGYKYWVTCDAGSIDLQITTHFTCDTRECAAKTALENGLSGEMGGGECSTVSHVGQSTLRYKARTHTKP